MGPLEKVLERLPEAKELGPGRYLSPCPGHDDRHPSFKIREVSDGTVLLKCWAGCSAAHIVASIGLELKDLFPKTLDNRPPLKPYERWVVRDVIKAQADQSLMVVIAASAVAAGKTLSEEDNKLLIQAAKQLHAAAMELGYD